MNNSINILVLCTGNSCRSQIAEGYLRHFAAKKANIYSAGIETHGVNQHAINTMLEETIDIHAQTSNHIDEYATILFDYVITVCDHAQEKCPIFPASAKRLHANFADPAKAKGTKDEIQHEFRRVRDQIKLFCKNFVQGNL